MKNIHPIEALILAVLLVATAVYELTVALLALVLTLVSPSAKQAPLAGGTAAPHLVEDQVTHGEPSPSAPAQADLLVQDEPVAPAPELVHDLHQEPEPVAPAAHPLLLELEGLTVRQLRTVAGVASKRHRKAELIQLAGMAMAC